MQQGNIDRRLVLQSIGAAALASEFIRPAQAQDAFMVFFNYGSAELPRSANEIVDTVRKAIKKGSRITVTGHCDTAEPKAGALGMARAVAVVKALTAQDLPDDVQLTVQSKGATSNLMRTGANTKEPQNRRVAIAIA